MKNIEHLVFLTVMLLLQQCEAKCESNSVTSNGKRRCVVDCKWGNRVCECEAGYDECQFSLDIDEMYSFTSYEILGNEETLVKGTHGVIYSINASGHAVPISTGSKCSNFESNPTYNCTIPNWTNSRDFKVIIGVNGLLPGPTLIVDEGSTVIAYVNNNLTQEATSIHWHGMRQYNTPWMDGAAGITQCPIKPSSNFQYTFIAEPSGTFWYHSHLGMQRADGCFGALIIRENAPKISQARALLSSDFGINSFLDRPDIHTLIVNDWNSRGGVATFLIQNGGLGDFSDTPIGMIPTSTHTTHTTHTTQNNTNQTHQATTPVHHHIPFHSGLINGLGRHHSVPFVESRLSEFTVAFGNIYRFRLIGAQANSLFRFSIDNHKLTVISTDGYFIEPIENVNYIIIHSGERYDFLLTANQTIGNYIMRLETLDLNTTGATPPFPHLGYGTQAILHYTTAPGDGGIHSSDYEDIYNNSTVTVCDAVTPCRVVNCPFENFHPSYYSHCINIGDFRLLLETPADELPSGDTPDNEFFLNFNFEAHSSTNSINGRRFVIPPVPIQTQPQDFKEQATICDTAGSCNPSDIHCWCTHVIEVGYNKVVQMVVSTIGSVNHEHSFHLHGHHFYVVKIGYPSYSNATGDILAHNSDIFCADSTCAHHHCTNTDCTEPSWANGLNLQLSVDANTPRKDTVIIPAGGYVVIRFISNNPGAWFLHCHILVHMIEGMAMILNVAPDFHNPPPVGFEKCGNFEMGSNEFYEKLQFVPSTGYQLTSIYWPIMPILFFFVFLLV